MKILKKIGSIVLDVLIVIVFIVSILVVVSTVTAKSANGHSNFFGYTLTSVQTDSMKDTLDEGDLIVSELITDENREEIDLKKDDIVTYYDAFQKKTITHRIVEVSGEGNTRSYTTWGDNRVSAPAPDVPITINEIESVYVFKIPFLGGFIDFLKTPFGFIICLVIPLLAFIAYQAYKLITLYLRAKKLELAEEAAAASEANAAKESKSEISEEEKNAIIAEYLAKQALEKQAAEQKTADDEKSEEKAEEEPKPTEEETNSETEAEDTDEVKEETVTEENDGEN